MAGKIIAQIVLVGTQVVGRAFMEAYRQAVANPAAKNAAARAAGGNGSKAVNELTRKTGMSVEEAAQILNVETSTSLEQLQKVCSITRSWSFSTGYPYPLIHMYRMANYGLIACSTMV
jgi:hypothetical protein